MINFIKSLFGFGKQAEPEVVQEQQKAGPVKCGCGRSQSGNCEGLHKLSQEEWATHAANPKKPTAPAKKKPAGKKPAGDKKPSGDKKPRGPRKPKAPKAVKSA